MWRLQLPDGRSLPLRELPTTLGRDDAAGVRVRHASIAPLHARLRAAPDGRLVVEAAGEAVVVAGGFPVRVATLDDGDSLTLGGISFTVRRDAAPAAAAAPTAAEPEEELQLRTREVPTAARAAPATQPQVRQRTRGPLASRRAPPKQGFLHADFSQISGSRRALLLGGALLVAAALAAGIAVAFSLFR